MAIKKKAANSQVILTPNSFPSRLQQQQYLHMFSQATAPPSTITTPPSENISHEAPQNNNLREVNKTSQQAIATPSPPETLPSVFSTDSSPSFTNELTDQKVINTTTTIQLANEPIANKAEIQPSVSTPSSATKAEIQPSVSTPSSATKAEIQPSVSTPSASSNKVIQPKKDSPDPNGTLLQPGTDNLIAEESNLLVGIIINKEEVGNLEIIKEENTFLIPLNEFAQIASFTVEKIGEKTQFKTPLGVITLANEELKQIKGVTYISDTLLKEKLNTIIQFKASELALIVDLPWRRSVEPTSNQAVDLQPEAKPSFSAELSNLRQELYFYDNSGNSNWRSASILAGRVAGGTWRLRLDNNFINQPNFTEYYFFKRSGSFLYQVGKQQISAHPLLSGVNFTGAQFGYTNLPKDRLSNNYDYSANAILPRRSQPVQTLRGVVPPTSFVQLRVGGVVLAQQQVGFSGEYEFSNVLLPTGQANEIELLIFDRNNLSAPIEIRSLRLNASDLLLPSGGNVQLAGLGFTGNLIQDTLFNNDNRDTGRLAGFYQIRQGISNNLTLEGAVQLLPESTQGQAGFAWRLADPVILAASVGTSRDKVGYTADLDIQLARLQILGNSEFYPQEYFETSSTRDRFNHSLETRYKFSNNFNLGFVARSRQYQDSSSEYILPTFSLSPANNIYFGGRPNFEGQYLLNAFYQATQQTRLSFNSVGDTYTTDLRHNLNREYSLSFGTEFGGDLSTRYTLLLNRSAPSLAGLSWQLGMAYRDDGEVGAVVGAGLRVLPGLYARVDYQTIPSRFKSAFGGAGDEQLTVSLVSDLSFSQGRVSPSDYNSFSKNNGGIAGRVVVQGGRKGFNIEGATVRAVNRKGQTIGASATDAQGSFFIGNLPEDIYIVELDPNELPVEITLKKTSVVAEVAASAVTKLDFPVQLEYGLAGRITDATGKPIPYIEVEVINAEGKKVSSAATDEFGLYRLDSVPIGKYTLRIPPQDGITNSETFPTKEISVDNDFIYDQNLQLPFTPAVPENTAPAATPQ